MADQLDMNGLSIHDPHHGMNGAAGGSTYIPPHMRGVQPRPPQAMDGPPPPLNGGLNDSVWAEPPPR